MTTLRQLRLARGQTLRALSHQLVIADAVLSGVERRERTAWRRLRRVWAELLEQPEESLFEPTGLARLAPAQELVQA